MASFPSCHSSFYVLEKTLTLMKDLKMTQIQTKFVYDPEHAKGGEEVELYSPYILSFDAKSMTVSDYHSFSDQTPVPLTIFKAVFINTLEGFINSYAQTVWAIVAASEECKQRKRAGKAIIDPQAGVNLIGRAQARLDTAYRDIMTWDGSTEFNVLLPYTEISLIKNEIIGQPDIIDTDNSRPYVNGVLFCAKWTD